jgi:hypothetical protein
MLSSLRSWELQIKAAMPIVVAEGPAAARKRSEAAIVDLLEGFRR